MQQFQSLIRLLIFYTLTLLIMLFLYYFLLFDELKSQSQQHSVLVFEILQHEATEHLTPTNEEVNQIEDKLFLQDLSYQLILMLPSGQTYIHQYVHPNTPSFDTLTSSTLSATDTSRSSAYELDEDNLRGVIDFASGHQLYVNLRHQPVLINWISYRYWLPVMVAILLFMLALFYMLKRRVNWEQLIQYAEDMTLAAKKGYSPPPINEHNATSEFRRLGYSLSRVSYRLNSNHRRISTLRHRLERLVDESPLPMLMVMRQGQVSFFNKRFEQVFATLFQSDVHYELTDFVVGNDKSTQQLLQKLSTQRVTRTLVVTSLVNQQNYQLHMTPWFGKHGQIHGFTILLSNIDEWVRQISSLQSTNAKLQLQIDEFAKLRSIIGHELRTPLNAIIGTLDLVEPDELSASQRTFLTTLTQSSHSMLTMLNDMLDMAKIKAGKTAIIRQSNDIFKLSQQVSDLMVGNARRQDLELLYFFSPDAPRYITTDASRLRQILLNLLDNAIKFTSSGHVALTIEPISYLQMLKIKNDNKSVNINHTHHSFNANITSLDNDINETVKMINTENIEADTSKTSEGFDDSNHHLAHQWIRFSVKDTGIGIKKEEQRQLFSYFNQANDQISQSFGGTGLGLAISASFAKLLGGFIQLESDGHTGSTFSLYIPCLEPVYQPVYYAHSSLADIHLIALLSSKTCVGYFEQLCRYLSISATLYSLEDAPDIQTIKNQLTVTSLAPVLLIDYNFYKGFIESNPYQNDSSNKLSSEDISFNETNSFDIADEIDTSNIDTNNDDNNNIDSLLAYSPVPKLLLSMKTERSLPSTLLDKFDGFLNKPLDVALTLSELIRLTQPALEDNLVESIRADKLSISDTNVEEPLSKPMILVVDDNATNQTITCKLLKKLGYPSIVANNGEQALQQLQQRRSKIALVLMDCRMPVMDGLQATQAIRAQGDSIPIIALSANNTETDRNDCRAVGMNDFIEKPINRDRLKAVLQRFITT